MKRYKLPLVDGREIDFVTLGAEDADRYYQSLLLSETETSGIEEFLFNMATEGKYLDQLHKLDAGIVLVVVYLAFSLSGVLKDVRELPELIEEARDKAGHKAYNLLYTSIIKAMPSYKPCDLKIMSLNELLELFAIAEAILGHEAIDLKKLREILGAKPKKKKIGSRESKAEAITKDELKSLTAKLDELQEADFDDFGRYIGDGNMM